MPAEYASWDRLVETSPDGSVYSRTDYLKVLCEATRGRFRVLVAERGDELLGGVALYEEPSRFGTYVSPRLLLYYNGFVVRRSTSRYPSEGTSRMVETLGALAARLAGCGYARLTLKSRSTLSDVRAITAHGWSARPSYSYVVAIGDLPGQWDRVEQNLRRLVERCGRQGLAVSDDDDFESFYRMHAATHARKGAALYLPRDRFQRYFEALRGAGLCRLYHARLADGRSISCQLVLLGHPVTHTVSAGADPEFLKLGSTAFLRWKVFEDLAAKGYQANDLTDAPLNPVTHFKAQLGGDLSLCLVTSRPDRALLRAVESAARARRAVSDTLRSLVRGRASKAE